MQVVVGVGVRDRRVEHLADDLGRVAIAEAEDLASPLDVLAADEVEHLPDLVRRDAHVAGERAHRGRLLGRYCEPLGARPLDRIFVQLRTGHWGTPHVPR